MTEDDLELTPKILILGSNPPTRMVTSYRWESIPSTLNVADFDTVILNFEPFRFPEIARSINIDAVPSFEHFARLIFSPASQIIAIGNPFFRLGSNPYLDSTWWLPLRPRFLDETGDTVELKSPEHSSYFEHVATWNFCLSGWEAVDRPFFSAYMQEAGLARADKIRPRVYSIAENRYGRAIGFTIKFEAMSERGGHIGDSGYIEWLPPTTDISVDEAIELILRDRFGIIKEDVAPSWLIDYVLPAEVPINQQIDQLESELGSLGENLNRARINLREASRFKRMLYETGEEALEPVVLDALEVLGAEIELPKVKGKEDGRIIDPSDRLGTLEIKGRLGPLRIGDVRQAHQWVADRIAYEETESKGILIANLNRDKSPSGRGEVFPSNCVKAAKNFEICLLTTTQLLNAIIMHQEGRLKISEFWDSILGARGICELEELP